MLSFSFSIQEASTREIIGTINLARREGSTLAALDRSLSTQLESKVPLDVKIMIRFTSMYISSVSRRTRVLPSSMDEGSRDVD